MKYPWIWIAAHGGEIKAVEREDAPPEVLRVLAGKIPPMVGVLPAVAAHPNTPLDVLEKFSTRILEAEPKNRDYIVLASLAKNPNITVEFLRQMAEGDSYEMLDVRRAVALNPKTPKDVLRALMKSANMRGCLAENPNLPEDLIHPLSKDLNGWVLHRLLQNPLVPDSIVRRLAKNREHHRVRREAMRELTRRGLSLKIKQH